PYAIPTLSQCDACHAGRIDKVLGFEAVSLSTPDATFDGQPALVALAPLLSNAPPSLDVPDDASGKARPALAWLHANCGVACHNPSPDARARPTRLHMRLEVGPAGLGAYTDTATYRTAVCRAAKFDSAWTRIRPHEEWKRSLV